jgi:hypothetical protein
MKYSINEFRKEHAMMFAFSIQEKSLKILCIDKVIQYLFGLHSYSESSMSAYDHIMILIDFNSNLDLKILKQLK